MASTGRDTARAEGFYGKILELPHVFTFGDLVFFDAGGTRLYLHRKDEQIKHQAYHDALTGLPNRLLLSKRIEQAIMQQLLTDRDRSRGLSVEFNFEGLLRGDSAGRASFYQTMTSIGAMTINEVRALENLPRVDGGDVPRMQMQNVPITEADDAENG